MSVTGWIILLLGAAAAAGFSYYTYFRREPVGRGRAVLTALRTAALVIIILLLIDPQLGARPGDGRNATRVVLDASLSMRPRAADSAAWRGVLERARAANAGAVIINGPAPRSIERDSLAGLLPQSSHSRILPALQAAAEGGAQRIVLVTDGAIDDAADVARWVPRLGVQLEVQQVEMPVVANRAIAEVEAPAWAEADKPIQLRIGIAARGQRTDSARVIVRQDNTELASASVPLPAAGRVSTAALEFPAQGPPEGGLVRFDIAFAQADAIPDDDVRSIYVFVSDEPAGVAIISFLPDWEPRFLHPVLDQALGVPVRTFLRVPNGSYFRAGEALQAGTRVEETAVRAAVAQADLLVLHGVTENAPAWWRDAAAGARRVIIFPADALGTPYDVSAPIAGDWYVSPDIPPSPLAAYLQNLELGEVPPLQAVFTAATAGGWTPLYLGRTRRGGNSPLLLAQQIGNRRTALVLGSGYWRWAFRGGAARDLYYRVWGSLAGWMVQDQPEIAGAAVRPVHRSVPRGEPMRWLTPGITPDSLEIRMVAAAGAIMRVISRAQQGDTTITAPIAPGHYRYQARAFESGAVAAESEGAVTVESYSPEFMPAPADLGMLRSAATALAGPTSRGGRPLHASPWPYVILVLLLCAEWVLRRRWGLR
jgi:hypothetical protein